MTKREFLDKLKKALANDLSGNVIRIMWIIIMIILQKKCEKAEKSQK